jgi:hypothetical protein
VARLAEEMILTGSFAKDALNKNTSVDACGKVW